LDVVTRAKTRLTRADCWAGPARALALGVLAGACVFANAAAQSEAGGAGAVRAELDARIHDLLAAYRGNDPLAVAAVFADDATISGPNGLRVRGRAAIDSFWTHRSLSPAWTIETFQTGGGRDEPWQVARSTRVTTTAGRPDTTRTDFLLVWKRAADGKLRIYYDIFN